MSEAVAFDYVSRARRMKPCKHCHKDFAPRSGHPQQMYCGVVCKNQHISGCRTRFWVDCRVCGVSFRQSAIGQRCCTRRCAAQYRLKHPTPKDALIAKGSTPTCCGAPLHFSTDRLGRTVQDCAVCGERPVQLVGKRIHDQRATLETELLGKWESVQTEPKPQVTRTGDAWRQESHRG